MQQVLLNIPITEGGLPIYGFGAMLFLTFLITAMIWGPRRVQQVGMPKDKLQDLAIVIFLTGIAGARIVYMIQYSDQFPDKSPIGLVKSFFQIWNGGIVFYGSVFGGLLGFYLFHRFVLRRLQVSIWKLTDAIAPLIAIGLAVGRIGCYLNGCCWGQPACEECQTVPLAAELGQFPLLPAHARDQVCRPPAADSRLPQIHGLQTSTGFSIEPREKIGMGDPRSQVLAVEPKSAASRVGLQPGDRVVQVNGQPNRIIVEITGATEQLNQAIEQLKSQGGVVLNDWNTDGELHDRRIAFENPEAYQAAIRGLPEGLKLGLILTPHDTLWEMARDWPRGVNELSLVIERNGQQIPLTFVPRTVPFFPTQLYETVSMVLLTLLLLAFQPFRRHDGQVLVVLMLGYAVHRFLNEAIRIEPTYALNLTLSQWISIGIFATGILLEIYLRLTRPRLPDGPLPLSYGVAPR
jgi:phosphatidylglycerol---prolipoprotein diacylglyceryl transferase